MSRKADSLSGPTTARRAVNTIRAAGAATIVGGLLTVAYVVLFALLAPIRSDRLEFGIALTVGIALVVSGVGTLRRSNRSLWATVLITATVLAVQLWTAYGGGSRARNAGLSVYLLTVPMVVLLINTFAVGAARSLPAGSDGDPRVICSRALPPTQTGQPHSANARASGGG